MGYAEHHIVEVEIVCASEILTGHYPRGKLRIAGIELRAFALELAVDTEYHIIHVMIATVVGMLGAGKVVLDTHGDTSGPVVGHERCPRIFGMSAGIVDGRHIRIRMWTMGMPHGIEHIAEILVEERSGE